MDVMQVNEIRTATEEALDRIRSHRFVRTAHDHQLSKAQVLRWLYCAGRESESFPDILVGMIKHTPRSNPIVLEVLRENLRDEYGNGSPDEAHFQHYLHLLGQIGQLEAFYAYQERAGIRLALDLAYNMAVQKKPGIAIGYMLVNEGMTPITYGAIETVIYDHFPELETPFFKLHVEVDEHHVAELYRAVAAMSPDTADDILFGIALGERGMGVLLDEALGVFDDIPVGHGKQAA